MSEFTYLLKERMAERGFILSDYQLAQFGIYGRELRDWNARINLTSLTDDLDIIDKHFIDSLSLVRCEPPGHSARVADVGTGAGFPGIPIKIYQPDIQLSLLESIGKKALFLRHIVAELKLENVDVVNQRAEAVARDPERREQYDLAVARCVARLSVLAEYCLPLLSVGGKFVAYKGSEAEAEAEESEAALEKLGGRLEIIQRIDSTSAAVDTRALVFIQKIEKTPDRYPRRPGMPRKRPL